MGVDQVADLPRRATEQRGNKVAKPPGGGRDFQVADARMTGNAVCPGHFWLRPGERCPSGSMPGTAKGRAGTYWGTGSEEEDAVCLKHL